MITRWREPERTQPECAGTGAPSTRTQSVDLTDDQVTRLVSIILRSIRQGARRRFVRCVRLALALGDPRIAAGAEDLADDPNPEVRRRARRLSEAMGTVRRRQ